jgi:hypothetical protein
MSTLLCPLCNAEYLDTVATCADCRVDLIDPNDDEDPRHAPEDEQVVYELGEWTLDQRTLVSEVMANSQIPHVWVGDELIVHERYEAAVDRLLAPIDGDGDGDGDGDEPTPDPANTADFGADGETEYDLSEWDIGVRANLVARMVEAGVPHRWEGGVLVVPSGDEAVIDDMLDDMEAGGDSAALEDDGAETPFEVLEALFLAADRLAVDPGNHEGRVNLVRAMNDIDDDRPPYGMEVLMWHRTVELGDALVDELSAEVVVPENAMDVAADLRKLLRPFV